LAEALNNRLNGVVFANLDAPGQGPGVERRIGEGEINGTVMVQPPL